MPGLFHRLQSEIETRERAEGITAAGLLDLSPELRRLVNLIMRRNQMSLSQIVFELDMKPSEVKTLLDTLTQKGYLKAFEIKGETHYKTFLARKRGRKLPLNIWETLGDKTT